MFRISFFVDDKNLGEAFKRLTGIARNIEHAYVPNVEGKKNGQLKVVAGDVLELFMREVHKRGLKELKGPDAREIVEKLGRSPTSYSHFLQRLVTAGALKKGKKEGLTMTYLVRE